jgi:hypothetical protein
MRWLTEHYVELAEKYIKGLREAVYAQRPTPPS